MKTRAWMAGAAGALLVAAGVRAQDEYCVSASWNNWDTTCQVFNNALTLQPDGTYQAHDFFDADAPPNWAAWVIYEKSASPAVRHGALWGDDDAHPEALLYVAPEPGNYDGFFFLDPRDRSAEGWVPNGPTVGADAALAWSHPCGNNCLDGVKYFWQVLGDFEVSTGVSYFEGVGCSPGATNCLPWMLTESGIFTTATTGAGWDQSLGRDGVYTFGMIIPSELAGTDVHWRAATNTDDGQVTTQYGPSGWLFVQDGTPSLDPGDVTTTLPAEARGQLLLLEFDAYYGRLRGRIMPPPKLLLTELVTSPLAGEYVELYNPTDLVVSLENYYLSDVHTYHQIPQSAPPSVSAGDFIARFPAGARIEPHTYEVVSLHNDLQYTGVYGATPGADYKLHLDSSGDNSTRMREAFSGSIPGTDASPMLTDTNEMVVLFHWDGINDLVFDVDYVFYGAPAAPNSPVNKSSVSAESDTDSDAVASDYQDDADFASATHLHAPEHASGLSIARVKYDEIGFDGSDHLQLTGCSPSGSHCNGISGEDETSEWSSLTWRVTTAPAPGMADFLTDGTPCTTDSECISDNCRLVIGGSSHSCVAAGYSCVDSNGDGLLTFEAACFGATTGTCTALDTFEYVDCDDSLACTMDSCSLGVCTNDLQVGHCLIGTTCVAEDSLQGGEECMSCRPTLDPQAWSMVEDGTVCTDTAPSDCKTAACVSGGCSQSYGNQQPTSMCDDGDACTDGDQCDSIGVCLPGTDICQEDAGVGLDVSPGADVVTASDAASDPDVATAGDATAQDVTTLADAGNVDSAVTADSAVTVDSAVTPDSAVTVDSAVTPDSAVTVDSALTPDSAVTPDSAGAADALVVDGAAVVDGGSLDTTHIVDAPPPVDGGNAPRIDPTGGGCSCRALGDTNEAEGLLGLLLLGLLSRRRRLRERTSLLTAP
ncbi:MAG: hypothetical protein ABIJ09_06190 [Pseudomonadota bacterium]